MMVNCGFLRCGASNYDQADFGGNQPKAEKNLWVSGPDADGYRTACNSSTAQQGSGPPVCLRLG